MAPRLVLHVGSHKTGTTSIQQALAEHRSLLAAHGVHYSAAFGSAAHSVPMVRMFRRDPAGYLHVARQGLSPEALAETVARDRHALQEEIARIGDDVLVISGEDIGDLRDGDLDDLAGFCRAHFAETRIVYVVRDPVALVRSIEHQLLRSGEDRAARFRPGTVAGRYDRVPFRFADAFGAAHVTVARFEDLVAADGGIVREFARRFLGVDDARLVGRVHNEGLSVAAVRALRLWNRLVPRQRPGLASTVARRCRGALVRLPGRPDSAMPEIDAAAADRIDRALEHLAAHFDVDPYPSVAGRTGRVGTTRGSGPS